MLSHKHVWYNVFLCPSICIFLRHRSRVIVDGTSVLASMMFHLLLVSRRRVIPLHSVSIVTVLLLTAHITSTNLAQSQQLTEKNITTYWLQIRRMNILTNVKYIVSVSVTSFVMYNACCWSLGEGF